MKLNFILLIVVLFIGCFAGSCSKDLGNYNYVPVNDATISGIPDSLAVLYLDSVNLKPAVLFAMDANGNPDDTSRYGYEWRTYNTIGSVNNNYTLGTTRELHIVVALPTYNYTVYFDVTDKKTGLKFRKIFKINVRTQLAEGWLFLTDVNGRAVLDMITFFSDTTKLLKDILSFTAPTLPEQRGPRAINTFSAAGAVNFYLSTASGTNKLPGSDFTWLPTYNIKYEFYGATPSAFAPDFLYGPGSNNSFVFISGQWYHQHYSMSRGYGVNINRVKGESEDFNAAPFLADAGGNTSSSSMYVLYDKDNKRFVRYSLSGGTTSLTTGVFFNFNTGKDLVYMNTVRVSNETTAVLKDGSGKRYLYRFSLASGQIVQTYYAEMPATDIALAEQFAVSPVFGYIFYNAGAKVYQYDPSLKTTRLMLDLGARKISVLRFHKFTTTFNKPDYESQQNRLIIASYDPALPEEGRMTLYDVPSRNEQITFYKTYDGMGKIVDISYKER